MKKLLFLTLGLAGLALGAGTITPAFATSVVCGTACAAELIVAGRTFRAPVEVDPRTGIGTVRSFEARQNGLFARIDSATLNPDPAILFATSFSNPTGIPQLFTIGFSIPILLSGTINAESSIGYTLTYNPLVASGVTLTAFNEPGCTSGPACVLKADDFFPETDKGVDIGPSVIGGAAPCDAFVGTTTNCGPFAATNTFSSPGGGTLPFTLMTATIKFILSPHSSAGLSGAVVQEAAVVPEPATLLLLGSGLLGFAGWRRYSSRA